MYTYEYLLSLLLSIMSSTTRKQGQKRAYVGRLETIRVKFVDVGMTDELLLEIIEVYAMLGDKEKAKSAETELKKRFASSELVAKAKSLVAKIVPAAKPKSD